MYNAGMPGMFLLLLRVSDVMAQSFRSEEGPFKTVISNVSRCGTSAAWFQWNMTAYTSKGRSLIRGTIRLDRTTDNSDKDIKFRILMYYLEEKKTTKVFDMKNQNCHNTIVHIILKTVAIPFDEQSCRIKAGSYVFKDMDIDAIIHSVVQSLWYGDAQLRVVVTARGQSLMCSDIYYKTMKLK